MTDQRKIAFDLAKAHIESTLTDYVAFGFSRNDSPQELIEFGNVGSAEIRQKMYELFLAKIEQHKPLAE